MFATDETMQTPRADPVVYLDANPFIYLIEGDEETSNGVEPLFQVLKEKPGLAITSEITLAEVLAPTRKGPQPPPLRRLYLDLMVFSGCFHLEPVNRQILYETAESRKVAPMKLVDAIHLVTAIQAQCAFLVSRDSDFRRMPKGMTRVSPDSQEISNLVAAIS